MTDDRDELLLRKYFNENKTDVPDDGFSRRVMRRLPDRARRLNHIWTAVCLLLGTLLCVASDWLGALSATVKELAMLISANPVLAEHPYLLWQLLVMIIFVGGYKALAKE